MAGSVRKIEATSFRFRCTSQHADHVHGKDLQLSVVAFVAYVAVSYWMLSLGLGCFFPPCGLDTQKLRRTTRWKPSLRKKWLECVRAAVT